MILRLYLIVFSAVLITACTSSTQHVDKVNFTINKEVCCQMFNEFSYTQLSENETLEFYIDEQSPIGKFNDAKSYFSALELPERAENVSISIDSLMLHKEVFAPTLLLLNDEFKVVEKIELSQFTKKTSSLFTGSSFNKEITINRSETPYLILYSAEKDLGKYTKVTHPAKVRAQEFGEPWPMATDPTYIHSLTGKIQITIKTITLRSNNRIKAKIKSAIVVEREAKILSETESFYNQQITKAVASNDIKKALQLVNEAKRLGSNRAENLFIKLLKK